MPIYNMKSGGTGGEAFYLFKYGKHGLPAPVIEDNNSKTTVNISGDNLEITVAKGSTSGRSYVIFNGGEMIDLTEYTSIIMTCDLDQPNDSSEAFLYCGTTREPASTVDGGEGGYTLKATAYSTGHAVCYDLSEITGERYISICHNASSNDSLYMKVKEISLLK